MTWSRFIQALGLTSPSFRELPGIGRLASALHLFFADMLDESIATGVVEIRGGEELTHATAAAFTVAVRAGLESAQTTIWLNLEDVKATDVVGLAALAHSVRHAVAAGRACAVFASPSLHRGLDAARALPQLPMDGRRATERATPEGRIVVAPTAREPRVATGVIELRPATWDDLPLLERWAHEPLLDDMVGSALLAMCRERAPYHPDVVAEAVASPTALTLLIHPWGGAAEPVGFVRLHGIDLGQGFACLETAVAVRPGRIAWASEATRLAAWYALERLGLRRLETTVARCNALSVRALKRNGFVQEGVQGDDILVFAMLEPEMRAELTRDRFPRLAF